MTQPTLPLNRSAPPLAPAPDEDEGPVFLVVTDEGDRRWVRVTGRARDFLRRHGVPAMHSVARGGWYVHRSRVADVLARAQADGIPTTMRDRRPDRGAGG